MARFSNNVTQLQQRHEPVKIKSAEMQQESNLLQWVSVLKLVVFQFHCHHHHHHHHHLLHHHRHHHCLTRKISSFLVSAFLPTVSRLFPVCPTLASVVFWPKVHHRTAALPITSLSATKWQQHGSHSHLLIRKYHLLHI